MDEIFAKLADNETIQKMYSLWCEMEQQKHDVYSSAKVQFPKLVDNKEFKSVNTDHFKFSLEVVFVAKSDRSQLHFYGIIWKYKSKYSDFVFRRKYVR